MKILHHMSYSNSIKILQNNLVVENLVYFIFKSNNLYTVKIAVNDIIYAVFSVNYRRWIPNTSNDEKNIFFFFKIFYQ